MIDRIGSLFADVDSLAWLGTDVAVKATLLCLLALAAGRLLGRRVLARSAVWHACLLGLVLLPLATACFPQWRVACLPHDAANSVAPGLAPGGSVVAPSLVPDLSVAPGLVPGGSGLKLGASKARAFAERKPTTDQPTDWARVGIIAAAITYLAGMCLLLVRLFGSWRCARRLVRFATAVDDANWNQTLDELCRQLGLVRRVELRSTPTIGVPLIVGWWRPTILLPDGLAQSVTSQARRAVLLHELAHARRGDYAWNLLLRLTQAIYWPHPLIWLSGKAIARVREEACDRLCVYWLGDVAAYRETLVELAAGLLRRPAASLGMAIARTTRLERRLVQLEHGGALPRCLLSWPLRTGLATAVVAAAGALATLHLERSSVAADPTLAQAAANPQRPVREDSQAESKPAAPAADDSSTPTETKQPEPGEGQVKPAEANKGPVRVRVAKVRREDFVIKSVQPCSVVASRTVQLHSRVSGVITRRNAELGDRVKKGDVLAEIDAPEVAEDVLIAQANADEAAAAHAKAEAGVEVAQANVAEADAELLQNAIELEAAAAKVAHRAKVMERINKLIEERGVEPALADEKQEQLREARAAERAVKGARRAGEANVSRARAEVEAAKAGLQVAKLRAEAAQRHLERIRQHTEYLQIRAPIDGAITEISANVGSLTTVGSGEPLLMISSIDTLTAVVELPEADALRVKRGDTATVRFDALPGRTFQAAISRMAYAFSPTTRTLRTEIDLNNPDGLLRPGMQGAAAVHLETHQNVLTIPESAIFLGQVGGKRVYRVANGHAVQTPIRASSYGRDGVEVLEGLSEGDTVVTFVRMGQDILRADRTWPGVLAPDAPVEIDMDDDE